MRGDGMNVTQLAYALAIWSLTAFGATLLVVEIVCKEIGIFIARRLTRKGRPPPGGVGVVVGSMLGLFAFVLALTLSFANARFNERLDGTIQEANAIGTAWLRAKAIGDPRGDEIARQMEDYAKLRRDFIRAPADQHAIDAISSQTSVLQSAIWTDVGALVQARPDPIAESLMSAVNQSFDMSAVVRFAFDKRLPAELFWLLIGMTALCMGALGFQLGLRDRPLRVLGAILAAMWAAVIVEIIDLAATRVGSFRTSAAAYEWTIDSFQPAAAPGGAAAAPGARKTR
jgi:hypothetical protein